MLHCDLPDSPLASFRRNLSAEIDDLPGHIRDAIDLYGGAVPASMAEFQAACRGILAQALRAADAPDAVAAASPSPGNNPQSAEMVAKLLQLMSRDTDSHYKMRALCYLRLMGREGRSFQALANELGVVRATVHNCYRDLQKRMGGIPGLGDKSPEAREKYRLGRLGKRRERGLCHFTGAWSGPATPLLLLEAA
jgi:hypothetical protein